MAVALPLLLLLAASALIPLSGVAIASGYVLAVTTNSGSYSGSQTVFVNGSVTPSPASGTSVGLTVFNPAKVLVETGAALLTSSGTFAFNFTSGGTNWIDGTYVLKATWSPTLSGPVYTANDTFSYLTTITTTTSVSCSPSHITTDSSVICSGTVTASVPPTGTLSWRSSSATGTFGASSCTLSGGSCSVNYTDSSAGTANITATYSGNDAGSSGSFLVTLVALDQVFTVSAPTSVVTLFVGPVLNVTFASSVSIPLTGIIWFEVDNSAGQEVAISGTSLSLGAFASGSVYLGLSTLPSGIYDVTFFATTLQGVPISPSNSFTESV